MPLPSTHTAHGPDGGCLWCCDACDKDEHRCPVCDDIMGHSDITCGHETCEAVARVISAYPLTWAINNAEDVRMVQLRIGALCQGNVAQLYAIIRNPYLILPPVRKDTTT